MRYDDRNVLEEVQAHLRCGKIYELDFGRYRGYEAKGWHPHAKFRVGNIVDLRSKVVPFFYQHQLFGRKLRAFEFFAQLVEIMHRGEHRTPSGLRKARRLADQLAEHNKRASGKVP